MTKILDGIRIIDFTQGHTGSYGTMLLADFGAEVIKIENHKKGGDILRNSFPKNEKCSAYHAYLNRGKKSVCIDKNTPEGQLLIMKLIKNADVVCDCFAPGEMERCNIDYKNAYPINPGIIYASHTGFGKTGPLSHTAGCDLTSQAHCGLMQVTGFPDGEPTAHGTRMADQFGGVYFAAAIVMALMTRISTGQGQQIDLASADCMMTALEDCISEASLKGITTHREGNGSRAIAPYDTFQVKDGLFSTAVSTNSQWEKFCEAMDMKELIDDPRYCDNETRGENYYTEDGKTGLRDIISERFQHMTRQEISDLLEPWNIPAGPGFTVQDAFENKQLATRNMVLNIKDKTIGDIRMPGIPIKISGINDSHINSAPRLGENTACILKDMGCSERTISAMAQKGIVMCERSDLK